MKEYQLIFEKLEVDYLKRQRAGICTWLAGGGLHATNECCLFTPHFASPNTC
jgi:hypothetical protein